MLDVTLTQGEAIARLHRDETPRFTRGLSSLSLTLGQELLATPFVSVALTLFFFTSTLCSYTFAFRHDLCLGALLNTRTPSRSEPRAMFRNTRKALLGGIDRKKKRATR